MMVAKMANVEGALCTATGVVRLRCGNDPMPVLQALMTLAAMNGNDPDKAKWVFFPPIENSDDPYQRYGWLGFNSLTDGERPAPANKLQRVKEAVEAYCAEHLLVSA